MNFLNLQGRILFFKLFLFFFLQFFWTQMEPLADVEFCKLLGSATWPLRMPTNFEMKKLDSLISTRVGANAAAKRADCHAGGGECGPETEAPAHRRSYSGTVFRSRYLLFGRSRFKAPAPATAPALMEKEKILNVILFLRTNQH